MHRDTRFPLEVLERSLFQVQPPHSKLIRSGKHTADMLAVLKR